MSPILRRILLAVLIAGACLPWPAGAQPQYPSEPIKLIVPYAPGGVPDTTARLLAQRLQDRVGQTVVVENRAGGNGGVAAAVIAAAPADGTTLLVVDTTLLNVSPIFVSQLSYNPQKDFVPILLRRVIPRFLGKDARELGEAELPYDFNWYTCEMREVKLTAAGFEIMSQWLNPKTHAAECDEMVVVARKP